MCQNYCLSAFLSSLVQSSGAICATAIGIKKCSECTFHYIYFFFARPYDMYCMRTWKKLKFDSDDFWFIC